MRNGKSASGIAKTGASTKCEILRTWHLAQARQREEATTAAGTTGEAEVRGYSGFKGGTT